MFYTFIVSLPQYGYNVAEVVEAEHLHVKCYIYKQK